MRVILLFSLSLFQWNHVTLLVWVMENHRKLKQFARFADVIDIRKLEKETRKFLYLGFIVALLIHAGIGVYITYTWKARTMGLVAEKKPFKTITVDIITISPVMRKPFIVSPKRFRIFSLSSQTNWSCIRYALWLLHRYLCGYFTIFARTGFKWMYLMSFNRYRWLSTSMDLNRPWKRWPIHFWRAL